MVIISPANTDSNINTMLLKRHRYVNSALFRLQEFSKTILLDLPKTYLKRRSIEFNL